MAKRRLNLLFLLIVLILGSITVEANHYTRDYFDGDLDGITRYRGDTRLTSLARDQLSFVERNYGYYGRPYYGYYYPYYRNYRPYYSSYYGRPYRYRGYGYYDDYYYPRSYFVQGYGYGYKPYMW